MYDDGRLSFNIALCIIVIVYLIVFCEVFLLIGRVYSAVRPIFDASSMK